MRQIRFHITLNLLTCEWPGLRGGDRSSSESFPLCGRLLGGDWSESEPRLVFERILGGDWSESESCLFWALLDDELGFLLAGDESDNENNN